MSTSKDVAALAQVSPATVSRVFRNEGTVTEKTREKVLEAAKQLNYMPSLAASTLKKQASSTVAFINPDPSNPFYVKIISAVSRKLWDTYRYRSIMLPDAQYETDLLESMRYFLSHHVECIVFSSITKFHSIPKSEIEALHHLMLHENRCKFLQLHSNYFEDISSVYYNDAAALESGVEHLITQDHRRILIITDDSTRIRGVEGVYRRYGLTPEIPIFKTPLTVTRDEITEMIRQYRPTAVIAVAEYHGLCVYSAAYRLGLRIPEDLSVIIYDDNAWTEQLGISVIAHPIETITESSTKMIMDMIGSSERQVLKKEITPRLLLRDSVSKPQPNLHTP